MAKKPTLVHPLTCVAAINEYHERVGALCMAISNVETYERLGKAAPPEALAKIFEKSKAVQECWSQPD